MKRHARRFAVNTLAPIGLVCLWFAAMLLPSAL